MAYTVLLLVDGSRDVQIYFCDYTSLMNEENKVKLFQRKENTLTTECLVFGKLEKKRKMK